MSEFWALQRDQVMVGMYQILGTYKKVQPVILMLAFLLYVAGCGFAMLATKSSCSYHTLHVTTACQVCRDMS